MNYDFAVEDEKQMEAIYATGDKKAIRKYLFERVLLPTPVRIQLQALMGADGQDGETTIEIGDYELTLSWKRAWERKRVS